VRIEEITLDGAARPLVSAGGAFWGHDFGVVFLVVFGTLLHTHGLRARSHAQKSFSVYCSRGRKGRWAIGGSAALAGVSCVGADVCCCVLAAPCGVWTACPHPMLSRSSAWVYVLFGWHWVQGRHAGV
jgi:hypothetical protein